MMRLSLASLVLVAGCGGKFLEPSVLADLRVLAVEASPLEAGPGDRVTLRAVIYQPPGESLAGQRWTFCPFTAGATTAYRCALPACETELVVAADGGVAAEPVSLAAACAARLLADGGPSAALPAASIPSQVEGVFLATHRGSSGLERQTALPLPLWLAAPPPSRNRPPAIAGVSLGGEPLLPATPARTLAAGASAELRVQVDPQSLDTYADAAGRSRLEEPVVFFYTTAGRFSASLQSGTDVGVQLKLEQLEPGDDVALLYVVVRDGRGGQTAAGPFTVEISR
jgi:hypothetical protein